MILLEFSSQYCIGKRNESNGVPDSGVVIAPGMTQIQLVQIL